MQRKGVLQRLAANQIKGRDDDSRAACRQLCSTCVLARETSSPRHPLSNCAYAVRLCRTRSGPHGCAWIGEGFRQQDERLWLRRATLPDYRQHGLPEKSPHEAVSARRTPPRDITAQLHAQLGRACSVQDMHDHWSLKEAFGASKPVQRIPDAAFFAGMGNDCHKDAVILACPTLDHAFD